ncbi:TetR family transcriptional regulator [Companilactobacillus nuruki]|uniref:TetR family transcriptional regulator n=2 Tax=Companilactobacillus nuruki TaxID=1993540 RepID=A0A2N7AUW5_9LACO|nr:TetR family transcriptional regulator [Companilactobacillus nuruki]
MTFRRIIMVENKKNRRRGDQLQNDIYQAAYNLLKKEGYTNLTFSKIAKAAQTSRSVIYRYWDTPFDLVFEMIHNQMKDSGQIANTNLNGKNLQENLFIIGKSLTTGFNIVLTEFNKMMLSEMIEQPQKIHKLFDEINTGNLQIIDAALQMAIDNKEIKFMPSQQVRLSLFHLIRYSYVIENHNLDDAQLLELINEIVLPAIVASQK